VDLITILVIGKKLDLDFSKVRNGMIFLWLEPVVAVAGD
jgi:hypothetical protein